MKKIAFFIVLIILFVSSAYAQRFENLFFKKLSDTEGVTIAWIDSVADVMEYREKVYKNRLPMGRFAVVRDWMWENQYVQCYAGGLAACSFNDEPLFKQTGTTYSFSRKYTGYGKMAKRYNVPDEDYSIGMADNLSGPILDLDVKVTPTTLTYTIVTNQQGGCDFGEGGHPVRPGDVHQIEMGCKGGTHKSTVKLLKMNDKDEILCPFTYTCTHYIRQVPRTTKGRTVRKSGSTNLYVRHNNVRNNVNVAPGKVYIGKAGEYSADPFAPWQFTYKTKVTISWDEMAKANGLTKQELAFKLIYSNFLNGGLYLPTHVLKSGYPFYYPMGGAGINGSPSNVIAYCLWEIFHMESYTHEKHDKYVQQAQLLLEQKKYEEAALDADIAYDYWNNDSTQQLKEKIAYKIIMTKIHERSVKKEDFEYFLQKYKPNKISPLFLYGDRRGLSLSINEEEKRLNEEMKKQMARDSLPSPAYLQVQHIYNDSLRRWDCATHYRIIGPEKTLSAQRAEKDSVYMVDLGLSVLWADRNIGSKSQEDVGYLFAWGEIEPKEKFTEKNYKPLIKPKKGAKLNEINDPAIVRWGTGWHVPTEEQWRELFDNCEMKKAENGKGMIFIAKNGKSLFIPFTEYVYWAHYWTNTTSTYVKSSAVKASIPTDTSMPEEMRKMIRNGESSRTTYKPEIGTLSKDYGFPIRAVMDK